ncbi:MAG TPA: Nudix family hydrolase [Burkholderiales bacterium]|nr:Nudix family hydrolase [Burkholderiales bacterium]
MIEVAAAVLLRGDGAFLLAKRPEGKVYAGYWEFPGGKVEPGEDARQALGRELEEELGIQVRRAAPWITRVFAYPHGTVRLHFFRVSAWNGEPYPREHQAISWQRLEASLLEPMLPANAPVLASLALPAEYAVTDAARLGTRAMLELLERRMAAGLRMVQVREPGMEPDARSAFTSAVLQLGERYGCKVLVKEPFPGAHGIHLTASELMKARERPRVALAGASCHVRAELEHAMALGLDFAVVGPVLPTASHPGSTALGWEKFAKLVQPTSVPVYAIGGLRAGDLDRTLDAGGHGIAMLRGAWV